MAQEQRQQTVLGEQLTGLSPTVCRRAIATLLREDNARGTEERELPAYCEGLILLLQDQCMIMGDSPSASMLSYYKERQETLYTLLDQCTKFLDVVEGREAATE